MCKGVKEGLSDSEFEEYLTTIKNSKFMKKMNKYLSKYQNNFIEL